MSAQKSSPEKKMTEIQAHSIERGDSRRILIAALDESSQADDVFEFVCEHFNDPGTLVVFTYVAKPLDSLFNSFAVKACEAQKKGYLAEGWVKRAAELEMKFRGVGKVLVGDPREELVSFCDHLKPGCLVIGSHGRKALPRLVLGSVSDYCVHFCPCPVIVVKPPHKEKENASGYSSVFRLAAKAFTLPHFSKDKTQASDGGAKAEEGAKIELEDVVPMESPFPEMPKEGEGEAEKFPMAEALFPVLPGAPVGAA